MTATDLEVSRYPSACAPNRPAQGGAGVAREPELTHDRIEALIWSLVQVFDMRDPESPHRSILDHIGTMDDELSQAASHLAQTAQTYLTIASGKLDDENRIHPFQNLVSLFSSALGAAIVDPAAAIVTTDPGEWADAMEQSLQIEKEMGSLRR